MSDVKITSAEKVKDPRRVEAGRKLGAMSKQAKEAKRSSGNGSVRKVESGFQLPNLANVDPLTAIGVVGVVGMVGYNGYYGYYRAGKSPEPKEPEDCEEPKEPKDRVKPKRVYRQLDTLG